MTSVIGKWTAKGLVRKRNEDNITDFNFYFQNKKWKCFAVADGIGGHNAGDLASAIAMEILYNTLTNIHLDSDVPRLIESLIIDMNKQIFEKSQEHIDYEGMGTTLTMALVNEDELHIGHVGDSRAYLFRDNKLQKLTKDHSIVGELVRSGQITKDEAMNHPRKNIILQAIGLEKELQVDHIMIKLVKEDFIMLCTDGLSDLISDDEIAMILQEHKEESLDVFCKLVLERGAHDNFSIIIIKWSGGEDGAIN